MRVEGFETLHPFFLTHPPRVEGAGSPVRRGAYLSVVSVARTFSGHSGVQPLATSTSDPPGVGTVTDSSTVTSPATARPHLVLTDEFRRPRRDTFRRLLFQPRLVCCIPLFGPGDRRLTSRGLFFSYQLDRYTTYAQ